MKRTNRNHCEWSTDKEMGNAWGDQCISSPALTISSVCVEVSHYSPSPISAIIMSCRELSSEDDSRHLFLYFSI